MTWDAQTYLRYGNERTRPAGELLARIPLDAPGDVVDLGCGPGNSTALLRARWPNAHLTGLDNAPGMIAAARASGTKADWLEADLENWEPDRALDVIYANAALQWVGEHKVLFPRLMKMLAKGGVLAVQMPRNYHSPSHVLLRQTIDEGPWAKTLAGTRDQVPVLTPEDYHRILEPHVSALDIWETAYLHRLSGPDAVFRWVEGTALVPYRQRLQESMWTAFERIYKERLARAYVPETSGITMFCFRRLFIVATK